MDPQQQQANRIKEAGNDLVFSYLTLRRFIGIIGMILPVMLVLAPERDTGFFGIEPSISDYYFTRKGDLLVVTLSVLGVFLFTYKGYSRIEWAITAVAGICAIGVAFVPTQAVCAECATSIHRPGSGLFDDLFGKGWHFIFAGIFLLALAIMSLVFFRKTADTAKLFDSNGKRTRKAWRNVIYAICGWVIILCVAGCGLFLWLGPEDPEFPVIFTLESIAVEAFGFSWLIKGKTLVTDK